MNKLFNCLSAIAVSVSLLASCASSQARTAAKPVLLAVSFGTTFNSSRSATIGAIERTLADAFPAYEVRRAFTSQIVIDRIYARDGEKIDNVREAAERLVKDGVKEVVVQPTHLMSGIENREMRDALKPFEGKFDRIVYGQPLLTSDADYDALIEALADGTRGYLAPGTAIAFMGHGTEAASNAVYAKLAGLLSRQGYTNYIVGTVEAEPSLDDVIARAKTLGVKKIVLLPLMIVAGDHANNDMAGDGEDSWKSVLEAEGFEVTPVLKGLGEYEGVRQIFAQHARAARSALQ
jgi:sirohydrochlorin cobaltochelatase